MQKRLARVLVDHHFYVRPEQELRQPRLHMRGQWFLLNAPLSEGPINVHFPALLIAMRTLKEDAHTGKLELNLIQKPTAPMTWPE